ncbi:MAG TPA: ATP-binding cassette domain-containing protein [Ktedonobacteraceae bacterium]|nr:ATP-binding cassette domain-containing protein [Ktedonobacteraceae bacterium]
MPVIECQELTKAYGKHAVALNNLTLSIEEGSSFGLLGENGAGKSTLVKLIMGFIFPTSGRVRVLGEEDVTRAHSRIGYAHERPILRHALPDENISPILASWLACGEKRTKSGYGMCWNRFTCKRRRIEQSARIQNVPQALREFWRLPSMVIARFTLVSYIRSGWILGDIVLVWLLYAIFFLEFGGNVFYFFGTSGQGLGALAILGTVVLVQRAMSTRVYLPLSRITSRSAYMRGLVIATGVLRIPLFLILLILAASYHNFSPPPCIGFEGCISGATFSNILVGTTGLLLNCIVISTLIVAISAPIAKRWVRIAVLAWFAAVLYSSTNLGPIAALLKFTSIPLIPLATCYSFGTTGTIGWSGLLAIVIEVGYIVVLTLMGEYWLKRRDLVLQ